MTDSATYSLWFEPSGDIAYKLQKRIKKLSEKHQTPIFSPHVTLLGSINGSETELTSLTNTLASPMSPFDLELTKAGYLDTFYQSLFVHVKKTKELEDVRNRACQLFDCNEDEYMPHLSLLYGDLSQKEKQRILNLIGREFHICFAAKSIALMQTNGKPDQWKRIHTAVFKH